MAKAPKYHLVIREKDVVGPHKLDHLREWVERGVISPESKVCLEGDDQWVALSSVPGFYDFPPALRERIEQSRNTEQEGWRLDPATDKQLSKLRYFGIPFDESGLTKGRASELIDAITKIDTRKEEAYQNRQATDEQIQELRRLGSKSTNISYSEARELIEELSAEQEDAEFDLEFLDNQLNDDDALEFAAYKRLNKGQLKRILAYLTDNVPDWQSMGRQELADLVPSILDSQTGRSKEPGVRMVRGQKTIKLKCPHCLQHLETEGDMLGQEVSCPSCNESFTIQEDDLVNRPPKRQERPRPRNLQVPTATRRKKTVFAGPGALVEFLGFLALFFFLLTKFKKHLKNID